ncbi:uncharacterized protein LOC111047722 isoform X2 [Nilaparvata lugens]|uniref:uncharacterized protein LOC111047722 isoform X2 n=1 Tax=Nilaparvata lugens TaxID=108931 RepID=UPI00193DB2D8|nr:uncharacterized protein LOC111047722 isoform X2 [Nilaparvata lugens]
MDVYPMLSKSSSFPLIRPNYRRMFSEGGGEGAVQSKMRRVDCSLLGGVSAGVQVQVDSASAAAASASASGACADKPWIVKQDILPRMVAKRFKLMTRAFVTMWKSKLRKREDTLPTTTTATPATTTTTTTAVNNTTTNNNNNNNVIQHSNNHILSNGCQQQQQQQNHANSQQTDVAVDGPHPPFLWVYHTNGTSTTNSSQYTLYNNDQDTLVHNLQCEEARECKGFRKNLRGKWRRLVKKKPQQEVYTIPAELRDQLKQIYVY